MTDRAFQFMAISRCHSKAFTYLSLLGNTSCPMKQQIILKTISNAMEMLIELSIYNNGRWQVL
jgi:hypothetical protein